MPQNRMKTETLAEARDRLLDMSAAERRGFEAASEGQLIPMAESIADPDGPESELHEIQDALRMRPSVQDRADQDAVQATQDSVVAEQVERRAIRRGDAKAKAAKRSKKADKNDGGQA